MSPHSSQQPVWSTTPRTRPTPALRWRPSTAPKTLLSGRPCRSRRARSPTHKKCARLHLHLLPVLFSSTHWQIFAWLDQPEPGSTSFIVWVQVCLEFTGLSAETTYAVLVPAGTAYGSGSVLSQDVRLVFFATLPFTIPFKDCPRCVVARDIKSTSFTGIGARQLNILFPHGLAPGVTAEAIAARLAVSEIAAPWGGPPSPPRPLNFSVSITSACVPLCFRVCTVIRAHKTKFVIRLASCRQNPTAAMFLLVP